MDTRNLPSEGRKSNNRYRYLEINYLYGNKIRNEFVPPKDLKFSISTLFKYIHSPHPGSRRPIRSAMHPMYAQMVEHSINLTFQVV